MGIAAKPFLRVSQSAGKLHKPALVVFLHGLGDEGESWKSEFSQSVAKMVNARNVKYVFPTAGSQKVSITESDIPIKAWYDIYDLGENSKIDNVGINNSMREIQELINKEITHLGVAPERVILGGFSQGAVVSIRHLIKSEMKIGGYIILSGYYAAPASGDKLSDANKSTKALMCHGKEDAIIKYGWAEKSSQVLKDIGYDIDFKSYDRLKHSICVDELHDIVDFINRTLDPTS